MAEGYRRRKLCAKCFNQLNKTRKLQINGRLLAQERELSLKKLFLVVMKTRVRTLSCKSFS